MCEPRSNLQKIKGEKRMTTSKGKTTATALLIILAMTFTASSAS